MKFLKLVLSIITCLFIGFYSNAASADTCNGLLRNSQFSALPNTTIESAETVVGKFAPPDGTTPFDDLPSFCRVTAKYAPSAVSNIQIEVWLPTNGWNHRLEGVGNGGLAGAISYAALESAIRGGYASVSTDTGHVDTNNSWLSVPDLEADYGYRAIHGMTVIAKVVAAQFYHLPVQISYFNGCSTGGGQGIGEAENYPGDYDGILAGAAANFPTHLRANILWNAKATLDDRASYISSNKLPLITYEVLKQCGGPDAIADGFLDDPQTCNFNPEVLKCKKEEDPTTNPCFSEPQILAIRKIYQGAVDPSTNESIWPGFLYGSEGPTNTSGGGTVTWEKEIAGPQPDPLGTLFYDDAVLNNSTFNFHEMNFSSYVHLADQKYPYLNHISANIGTFIGLGHKLLMYHGFADPVISTQNSINYYGRLAQITGSEHRLDDFDKAVLLTQESVRLFMVPGMGHCGGGPGPVSFDALTPLVNWVEHGTAPALIPASHIDALSRVITFTRPLCPYPQEAQYNGSGDRTHAANWSCYERPFLFNPFFYVLGTNIYNDDLAVHVADPLYEFPVKD